VLVPERISLPVLVASFTRLKAPDIGALIVRFPVLVSFVTVLAVRTMPPAPAIVWLALLNCWMEGTAYVALLRVIELPADPVMV
jgi:hypothetical protein